MYLIRVTYSLSFVPVCFVKQNIPVIIRSISVIRVPAISAVRQGITLAEMVIPLMHI